LEHVKKKRRVISSARFDRKAPEVREDRNADRAAVHKGESAEVDAKEGGEERLQMRRACQLPEQIREAGGYWMGLECIEGHRRNVAPQSRELVARDLNLKRKMIANKPVGRRKAAIHILQKVGKFTRVFEIAGDVEFFAFAFCNLASSSKSGWTRSEVGQYLEIYKCKHKEKHTSKTRRCI
jgi:hypothetical protein